MAKLKDGFYKQTAEAIGSDLHVLLAGGGSKALSDFAYKSDLTGFVTGGPYLPTAGGTLTGSIKINSSQFPAIVLNNTNASGVESGIRFEMRGSNKGYVGYHNSYGTYIWNSTASRYLCIADDGKGYLRSTSTAYELIHSGNLTHQVGDWNSSVLSVFKSSENQISNAPTQDFCYGVHLRFHRDTANYFTDLVTTLYSDNLYYRRHTENGYSSWKRLAFVEDIPTKVSQLTNDAGYLTSVPTHGVHWENFTKRATSNATWGTLTAAKGYTPIFWLDSVNGGGVAFSDYNGKTYLQIDGDYYANEGTNLVLHTGNYNSYAPTLTGGGASGTWGIDISGTAAHATSASALACGSFDTASQITTAYAQWANNSGCSDVPSMGYAAVLNVGYGNYRWWQIWNSRNDHQLYWRPEKSDASGWADVHVLIDNKNIANYLPTVTNYYWADQLITNSAKSNATPTFGNTTIKSGTDAGLAIHTSDAYSRIRFYNSANENKATIHYFATAYSGHTFAKDTLNLGGVAITIGDWNDPTMYITPKSSTTLVKGCVGIGTTSPTSTLDVNGDVTANYYKYKIFGSNLPHASGDAWYNVYQGTINSTGDTIILNLSHSFWYTNTDAVSLAITVGYGNASINQISATGGAGIFKKVRVRFDNTTVWVDVLIYSHTASSDTIYVSGLGKGDFKVPTATSDSSNTKAEISIFYSGAYFTSLKTDQIRGPFVQYNYNQWLSPAYLQLGRADTTVYTDRGCIGITDGNLHIDAYKNKDIYLNYYQAPGSSGQDSTAVVVKPSGNVGIGTSGPAHKLDVSGDLAASVVYANRTGASDFGGVSLYYNSAPDTYGIMFRGTDSCGTHGKVTSGWATYFTMNDDASRGWIFRRGTTNVASISGGGAASFLAVGTDKYIAYPQGGQYTYSGGGITGVIKIKLPVSKSSTMMSLTITIYNYSTGTSATYYVGGYNYSDGNWYNEFAYANRQGLSGYGNLPVRFGNDGSTDCIYIGETTTYWSYPNIVISNVLLGHSTQSFSSWATGWEISITTSLGNINKTVTNPATNEYTKYARYVVADDNAKNPDHALLQSGSGRADASPSGDTWIYWDTLGGTSSPWGFKHEQADNYISFYGAGARRTYISLSNGYVYAKGFYHLDYGSSAYALTSDGGVAHIGSMSVNYAASAGYLTIHDVRDASRAPSYFPSYKISGWFNNTGTPSSDWYSGLHIKGWHDGYTSWELCSYSSTGTSNDYDLYFRNGNSSWGSWKTILNSSNVATYALKNYGADNSRPNGSTFTLPGGANVVSTRSGAPSGNDIGIFYLSDDNAFICNSSDSAYLFATFDTDKTANFSSADNAAFVVLSDHAGVKSKGDLSVGGLINSTCNGLTLTIGSQNTSWCHYSTNAPCHWFNTQVEINGALTPHLNNTYSLGSSTKMWRDFYTYAGYISTTLSTALPTYNNAPLKFGKSYNNNDSSNYRYRPWFAGEDLVNSYGYGVTVSCGIYRNPGYSNGGFYIGCGWDDNANSVIWKFSRDGNFYAPGELYASHFYESSDINLKKNIKAILDSDNIPVIKEFDWKSDGTHSYGLIAQELEEQGYSELVSDSGSHKTVNYSAALSLIVGKLQNKIKELEAEIENLKLRA